MDTTNLPYPKDLRLTMGIASEETNNGSLIANLTIPKYFHDEVFNLNHAVFRDLLKLAVKRKNEDPFTGGWIHISEFPGYTSVQRIRNQLAIPEKGILIENNNGGGRYRLLVYPENIEIDKNLCKYPELKKILEDLCRDGLDESK